VDAVHERLIWELETAVAERFVGVVGATVSGVTFTIKSSALKPSTPVSKLMFHQVKPPCAIGPLTTVPCIPVGCVPRRVPVVFAVARTLSGPEETWIRSFMMNLVDGTTFDTVTLTVGAVVVFPALSRATAVRVWVPFVAVVVFQVVLYGDVVSSVFRFTPSSLNWTPRTATLSAAVADMVTVVPLTVAADAGAVRVMVGGVVSVAVFVVPETTLEYPELFRAASVARTR
jgi:hypothetical protein